MTYNCHFGALRIKLFTEAMKLIPEIELRSRFPLYQIQESSPHTQTSPGKTECFTHFLFAVAQRLIMCDNIISQGREYMRLEESRHNASHISNPLV